MTIPIDIATEKVRTFAKDVPGINVIFSSMEKVESWILSNGKDAGFSAELRERLYDLSADEVTTIANRTTSLLWILFFLPTSTSFYLLRTLKEVVPNTSDQLLTKAVEIMNSDEIDKRHAQVFIDRCTQLNASNYISHITNLEFTEALSLAVKNTRRTCGEVY